MTATTNNKPSTRHNQHAHRMLQRSAAYLLAQGAQTGPQRTKSLWPIPAQQNFGKSWMEFRGVELVAPDGHKYTDCTKEQMTAYVQHKREMINQHKYLLD